MSFLFCLVRQNGLFHRTRPYDIIFRQPERKIEALSKYQMFCRKAKRKNHCSLLTAHCSLPNVLPASFVLYPLLPRVARIVVRHLPLVWAIPARLNLFRNQALLKSVRHVLA